MMSQLMDAQTILSVLIRFDTTSHLSNLALLDWIEDYLDRSGVACGRVFDETGKKANLIASIGGRERPGFVLSGHTDVVPDDGQDRTVDPFAGAIRDGRVWGRDASNMKCFIACALAAAPQMVAAPLKHPLHLRFSHSDNPESKGSFDLNCEQ